MYMIDNYHQSSAVVAREWMFDVKRRCVVGGSVGELNIQLQ